MKNQKKILNSSFKNRIVTVYFCLLLLVSTTPVICFSGLPGMVVTPTGSTQYTNTNYVNITVNVIDTIDVSSFINWNDSLVGYWNFENDSLGNFDPIPDNSSSGNVASYNGTYMSNSNITSARYGQGLSFNGSADDFLDCGNFNDFNITDELTLELWLKEYETTFNKTFSSGSDNTHQDYGMGVVQTSDGGYAIVSEWGYNAIGGGDICVIKTDSNGNLKKIDIEDLRDSGVEDIPYDIIQASNDKFIVVGATKETMGSYYDLFVKEYNSDLTPTGKEIFEDIGDNDYAYSIDETEAGNFILGGYFSVGSDEQALIYRINYSNWTSGSGDTLDLDLILGDSSNDERIRSIKETNDNKYITAGYEAIGELAYQINITQLNATDTEEGSINWSYKTGWGSMDKGYDVQQTFPDHGYIITGFTNRTLSGCDLYLLKLDESGNLQWIKNYNTTNKNWNKGYSVVQSNDGGYVTIGPIGDTEFNTNQLVLIKTNSNGEEEWNRTYQNALSTDGYTIKRANDGGYVIAGTYDSGNAMFDYDTWLLKTDAYGNVTDSNNNQSMVKRLVGTDENSFDLQLHNGTITGFINGSSISFNQSLSNLSQYWNHIAFTYNRTNGMILYLNGAPIETSSLTDYGSISSSINNLTIGNNFSGIIDEVRIWNRALMHDEINASYGASAYSYEANFTDLADDTYEYYSYGINTEGYENRTSTQTVTVDTTAPTVSIAYNISRNYYKDADSVRIFANFTETDAGITNKPQISINYAGGTDLPATDMTETNNTRWYYDLNVPNGASYDGQFTVNITATDNASNNLNPNPTIDNSKYVDNTAPVLATAIAFNNSETYYNGSNLVKIFANFTEAGSGIDENSVKITITNITGGTTVLNNSLAMTKTDITHYYFDWYVPSNQDCQVNVSIEATDNTSYSLTDVNYSTLKYIDNTAPTVSIDYNISTRNYYKDADTVRIFANFTEDGSGIADSPQISINYSGGIDLTTTVMTEINNTRWYYDLNVPASASYDGQFTVNITASDNASNLLSPNPTTNSSKYIDNTAPNITSISISNRTSNSAKISWTTNESCIGHVEYGKTNSSESNTTNTSSYEPSDSQTLSDLSANTLYYYRIFVYDQAGHMTNSSNLTFTTRISQVTHETNPIIVTDNTDTTNTTTSEETEEQNQTDTDDTGQNTTVQQTITNVTTNETVQVNFTSNNTVIVKVEFKSNNDLHNVNFTVEEHEEKPGSISKEPSKEDLQKYFKNITVENMTIYKYIDIQVTSNETYIGETILKENKIIFKVNKTWVMNNNITNVTLLRHHNSTWMVLKTTKTDENENYIIFEAKTPGFSTFAVVGSKVVEKGEKYNPKEPIPWIIIIGFILIFSIALIVVLIKARYIYIEK